MQSNRSGSSAAVLAEVACHDPEFNAGSKWVQPRKVNLQREGSLLSPGVVAGSGDASLAGSQQRERHGCAAELLCHARLVTLVSHADGILRELRHAEELAELPSLVCFAPEPEMAGEGVRRTVDLNTAAGYAHLLHQDAEVVERDYATLRALQPTLFMCESESGPSERRGDDERHF